MTTRTGILDFREGQEMMALVIVQPTQCGVRRFVAAFRTMRRRVAALHKLIHRAER